MMMVALHLRQRILARRSWTFSSAIEYLAPQEGQESFTSTLERTRQQTDGARDSKAEIKRDYVLAEEAIYHGSPQNASEPEPLRPKLRTGRRTG